MKHTRGRLTAGAALAVSAVLALAGCSGDSDSGEAAESIAVTSTDTECTIAQTELTTGNHTFAVENKGTQVTEFYVERENGEVLGEVENIAPNLTRELVGVPLKAGTYVGRCKPGMTGEGIPTTITVTGDDSAVAEDQILIDAVNDYKTYVAEQSDELLTLTGQFVDAVKAGDIDEAKRLYPIAREPWERIEPVAEIFGDLDPLIDGREGDVPEGGEFTGFHKLEKDLWVDEDVSDSGEMADRLLADVTTIVEKAKGAELTAAQVANGAKELLDEVASTKMTGEEDEFSHTDLWDFNANVVGAQRAIESLRPVLTERDPALLSTLDGEFATVLETLGKHKKGDGWKLHTELTDDDLKELSDVINALAEPLSQVSAKVLPTK